MSFSSRYLVLFGWIVTLHSTIAWAQTPPGIGELMQQASPLKPVPLPTPDLPMIGSPVLAPPLEVLPSGLTVEIKGFVFGGNQTIPAKQLQHLVSNNLGQRLSLAELENLAQRVTQHYRSQGYFVARAYIPAQEIEAGVIRIQVVEGSYGAFRLKNESLVNDEVLQGFFRPLKREGIVSLNSLEQALRLINDTPGVRVTGADVAPGQQVGSSDLVLGMAATSGITGSVLFDNYGSAYTGKNRVSFNLDVNSPSRQGDRISLGGLATSTGDLINVRTAYSILIMPNGLRGEASLGRTQYALGGTYSTLDAKGTANVMDVTLSYPRVSTRPS